MKFLFHGLLFWFALLCFIDFVLATSNNNITTRKSKNKAVKPPQKDLLPVNAILKDQKKQHSTQNFNTANISLRNDGIRIFLGCVPQGTDEFKFTYHGPIWYICENSNRKKNVTIFSNDLRGFLDALIFINFFKSFAHLFGNGEKWQLCLDVFKEFFEAIQLVNITKYLTYFTFVCSLRNNGIFKYSFSNITMLLLCNQIVNHSNAEIPECLKSFFQLIFNDPCFAAILKDTINIVSTSQSELHNSCQNTNGESHSKETSSLEIAHYFTNEYNQKYVLSSNYFNLSAIGILIQIMISIRNETVSASDITNSNQSNNLKISFYENIKTLFETLLQDERIKKNLSILYQMEFNEMITKILLETNPGNSSETSSPTSTTQLKTLFQPLEALIELLGHIIIESPVDPVQDKIITITERFVTLIEKLYPEHPDICDTLIKCLGELKKLFLRFFLSYLGNIYKKVVIDKVPNRTELFSGSSETLRKIEFIGKINSTLELLKNVSDWNSISSNLCHRDDSIISESNPSYDGIPELLDLNVMDVEEFFSQINSKNTLTDSTLDFNEFGDFNSGMQTIHNVPDTISPIVSDSQNSSNPLIIETSITKGLKEKKDHSYKKIVEILKFAQSNFDRLNIDVKAEVVFAEMRAISNERINSLMNFQNNLENYTFYRIKTGQYKGVNYKHINFNASLLEPLFQKRRRESLYATKDGSICFTSTDNIPVTGSERLEYFNSLLLKIATYNIHSAHSTDDLSEEYQSILQSLREITVDEKEITMLLTLMKDFMDIQAHLILI